MLSNEREGRIFSIERYAVHDGPGIRTLLFLKGCPLRCLWCFNPESQSFSPEIVYYSNKCINCNTCVSTCPEKAIETDSRGRKIVDSGRCNNCGICTESCPTGALKLYGERATVKNVLEEIKKDILFYQNSGGGVTLSGGEPMAQVNFTKAILEECQKAGIHTAIETCGYQDWKNFQKVLEFVDLVLYDIKHMDSIKHREFTGFSNELILSNAVKISLHDIPMIIRVPIVPGYNDSKENIEATAKFTSKLRAVQEIDLLPYKSLGETKYDTLGRKYSLEGIESPDRNYLKIIKETMDKFGLAVNVHD